MRSARSARVVGGADDLLALRLRDAGGHVVSAAYGVDDHDRIGERAEWPGILGKADDLLQSGLRNVQQEAPETLLDRATETFAVQEVGQDQLDRERLQCVKLRLRPPPLAHPHQRSEVFVPLLAPTNELYLARRAGLHHRAVADIILPAVSIAARVLDNGDDIHAQSGAHERRRGGLALDLEVLDPLVGIDLDQQGMDRLGQTRQRLLVDAPA